MSISLNVNGKNVSVDVDADTPLLWVLRDSLGLTGTKFGCGVAACGACSVLIDGQSMRSCSVPIDSVGDARVQTIEGLGSKVAAAVEAAWISHEVAQCGYCQSGQIVSAVALLSANATPTDEHIDAAMAGNICRCATYLRIRRAIHAAADALKGRNP